MTDYHETEVWLVRHGETEWSKVRKHTGRTDLPLTAAGEEAAAKLAPRLRGVHFDLAIVAGEIGSYKPALGHWEVFRERVGGADRMHHVHVAQSLYHDIAPAHELGIPSIWINRQEEPDYARASRTLMTTARLASTLDELVPP